MHPFWDIAVRPLLDAAEATTVVEVGAERGLTTALLLEWAEARGGTVHAIDPAPRFDTSAWGLRWGERFQFHRGRSLDLLAGLPPVDVALIDGDHNYFTVSGELRTLAQVARGSGRPMPLVIAHDTGWPYGRRDLYYDPASIPDEHRHDAARAGILPGRNELGEPGLNADLWNATGEGGPRNGVMTAIEDFVDGIGEGCRMHLLEGMHGLAVLATEGRLEAAPKIAAAIDRLDSPEFLRAWAARLETARIEAEIRSRAKVTARPVAPPARDRGLLD